ncbi:MAG: serpin family protein [Daejeonella sp.]
MKPILSLSAALFFAATQCNQLTSQNETDKQMVTSQTSGQGNAVTTGNNQFAKELGEYYINSAEQKNKNIFFSPFSISSVLAMTSEGARNQTALEMQQVLHLPKAENTRQAGFERLINNLNSGSEDYKLSIANALWLQNDYKIVPGFLQVGYSKYHAHAENVNFATQPEVAIKTINTWVEDHTNKRIKDLLSAPDVKGANLILTNAVYFQADWDHPFSEANTKEDDFTKADGTRTKAKMMSTQSDYLYYETSEAQVVELPYKSDKLSMVIYLPKSGQAIKNLGFTNNFTFDNKNKKTESVFVSLPKFKFETKYKMKDDLSKMGMPTPFSSKADFSGISDGKDLQIGEVIHQAFIEVNEKGTEASAATAVAMPRGAMPSKEKPKQFIANHLFVFAIKHNVTGLVLFTGVVNNPNL